MANGNDYFKGKTEAEIDHLEKTVNDMSAAVFRIEERLRSLEVKTAVVAAGVSIVVAIVAHFVLRLSL